MKNLFCFFLLLSGVFLSLTSCSNDESDDFVKTNEEVVIKSTLNEETVSSVLNEINDLYEYEIKTRSLDGQLVVTELQAKEVLTPFIEEGENIRQQIIEDMKVNPDAYPADTEFFLSDMDDENLAELGFYVYEFYNNPNTEPQNTPKWFKCLGAAFVGVDGLNAYLQGTKTLLTAKAALTIAKAFAKRSLGIVGTAWAIYDYYDCMNS